MSLVLAVLVPASDAVAAEVRKPPPGRSERHPRPAPPAVTAPKADVAPAPGTQDTAQPQPSPPPIMMPKETVEADVSSRSIALTSAYSGIEIVVFGTVNNSRQETAESGLYDVVVVLEGAPTSVVTRKKSNIGGIWLNTAALRFDDVPSYNAILSTRPLDEVAGADVLGGLGIGLQQTRAVVGSKDANRLPASEIADFKAGLIRLKGAEGLYVNQDYAVVFIGRALFRAAVDLPANLPAGPMAARVYLFRDGEKLAVYTAHVSVERQGFESVLYTFAFAHPFGYGLAAVALAVGAGLAASALFRRARA